MFGLFRKKSDFSLSDRQKYVLMMASNLLETNLMMSRTVPEYKALLLSDRVRGHLFGFFDAALFSAGCRPQNQGQFFVTMIYAHGLLLEKDLGKGFSDYVLKSVEIHGENQAFDNALKAGGQEYMDLKNGAIKSPLMLAMILRDKI